MNEREFSIDALRYKQTEWISWRESTFSAGRRHMISENRAQLKCIYIPYAKKSRVDESQLRASDGAGRAHQV